MKEAQPLRDKHDKGARSFLYWCTNHSRHRRSREKFKHFCCVAKYFAELILTEDF
jgi:hypothetical protein